MRVLPDGRRYEGDLIDDEDDSVGSGVIIHESGIVLTNSHVVANASEIIVRLADGREYDIESVRQDELSDVALLQMTNPPTVTPAKLGDSDLLETGDWVIAIGSPFELETTVSAGIISGKGRGIRKIERGKLLQTDAAINPGNSGGPLVNLDGEVIGINTAIASSSGGYQGIGFAIPSNSAQWVIRQLLNNGQVKRSYLGVSIGDLIPRDAASRGMSTISGALVSGVQPNTPAFRAGLQENDVIVEFAGMRVKDARDLQGAVEQQPVGSKHRMKIIRNGAPTFVEVTVDAWQPDRERQPR